MLTSTTVERILQEVSLRLEPATPDTPEEAKFRARIEGQVAEAEKKGYAIDIPSEWPSLSRKVRPDA